MPTAKKKPTPEEIAAEVTAKRKRLAVFCDGTWNDLRMKDLTNVARLAKCVESRGWEGRRQVVFYDSGVGVATGVGRLADRLVSTLGGIMGAGLDDKIESAYRFLVLNYDPGDEIFVFGFSRGAYTARSLCGLIRKCGILRREHFDKVPAAMNHYRDTKLGPKHPEIVGFRDKYTCKDPSTGDTIATGEEGMANAAAWAQRAETFQTPGSDQPDSNSASDFKWERLDPPPLAVYRLMYLGLWDTVGSMGVPPTIPFLSTLVNKRYKFYDTNASSLLFSIRHACALDEDRKVFDITPIHNIHALNQAWAKAHGKQVDVRDAPGFVPYTDRPYQQRWFPGSHGSVGGGNPVVGLSSGALVWVAVGALRAGLKFNWTKDSELFKAKAERDPNAIYRIGKSGKPQAPWEFDFIGFLTGYRDRVGPVPESDPPYDKEPKTIEEVQYSAIERAKNPAYRPATLHHIYQPVQKTPLHRIVARVAMGATVLAILALAAAILAQVLGYGRR